MNERRAQRIANRKKNTANRRAIREQKAIGRQADKLLTQINQFGYDEVIGGAPMGPAEELAARLYEGQLAQAQNSDVTTSKKKGGQMRNTLLNNIRFR